jgi:hypothetical protein
MLWQTEVAIPAGHQHHVVFQVLPLDLELLHDHDIGLKDIEHGPKRTIVAPWLIAERVTDAVDIPSGDTKTHLELAGWSLAGDYICASLR